MSAECIRCGIKITPYGLYIRSNGSVIKRSYKITMNK